MSRTTPGFGCGFVACCVDALLLAYRIAAWHRAAMGNTSSVQRHLDMLRDVLERLQHLDKIPSTSHTRGGRIITAQHDGRSSLIALGLHEEGREFHESLELRGMMGWILMPGIAILTSVLSRADKGLLNNLNHEIHAEYGSALLDEASVLLKGGHERSSAVLVRIVVERWIRDKAEAAGIHGFDTKKASVLLVELRQAKVFNLSRQRKIQAHLDVGNAAAHGRPINVDDTREMIDFADRWCTGTND